MINDFQIIGLVALLVVLVILRATLKKESPERKEFTIHIWTGNRWIKAEHRIIHRSTPEAWQEARRIVPSGKPIYVKQKKDD